MLDLKGLEALVHQAGVTKAEVRAVLRAMHDQGLTGADGFEAAYPEVAKAPQGPDGPHTFLIPLPWEFAPEVAFPARVRVLGTQFRFMDFRRVRRLASKRRLEDAMGPYQKSLPDAWMVAAAPGQTHEAAWQNLVPAFDAIRGELELTHQYTNISWSLDERARGLFPHPGFMFSRAPDGDLLMFRFQTDDGPGMSQRKPLSRKGLRLLKKHCSDIREPSQHGTTLSIIADCLRLYVQAMDMRRKYACLLGLWQMAEALTRPGGEQQLRGDTRLVVDRLSWINSRWGMKTEGLRPALLRIAGKRNDLVHRGIDTVDHDDLNILKLCCEFALVWLRDHAKSLPRATDLDEFYSLRTRSNKELDRVVRCVRFIKRSRKS